MAKEFEEPQCQTECLHPEKAETESLDPLVAKQLELGRAKIAKMEGILSQHRHELYRLYLATNYQEQTYLEASPKLEEEIKQLENKIEQMEYYLQIYAEGIEKIKNHNGNILCDGFCKLPNAVAAFYIYAGKANEIFAKMVQMPTDNTICVFTEDYLHLQDSFDQLEIDFDGNPVSTSWNREIAINSFQNYFAILNAARTEHIELWGKVKTQLAQNEYLKKILQIFDGQAQFQEYENGYIRGGGEHLRLCII